MFYYLLFAVTAVMMQIGCDNQKKRLSLRLGRQRHRIDLRKAMVVLAVLLTAAAAGLRDVSIGTDVQVYGQRVFKAACSAGSVRDMLGVYAMNGIEPGYLALAFLSSRISGDIHVFLFLTGLLIYSLIAATIYESRDSISPGIAWFCYCCLYFGDSFNIMRQTIALAIIMFAYRYVKRERIIPYVIMVAIAALFHQTAIIAMALPVFYWLLKKRNRWFHYVWIVAATMVGMLLYNQILSQLIGMGLLADKFSNYLSTGRYGLILIPTLFRLVPLAVMCFFWKRLKKEREMRFFLLLLILDVILYNATSLSKYAVRMSLYMGYFRILAYPMICRCLSRKNNRRIVSVLVCTLVAAIFLYEVVICNNNEIYPYALGILGT